MDFFEGGGREGERGLLGEMCVERGVGSSSHSLRHNSSVSADDMPRVSNLTSSIKCLFC